MATAKTAVALVLCDVVSHRLKAGHLVEATAELIKALAADGSVDPHKDAVAYARGAGYLVQRSSVEFAAEQREAALSALRVDIALLQEAHDKAADDTKAALAQQLAAKQAELAALLA